MPDWRSNKICSTVRGRYNWYWLRKGNNGEHNRRAVKFAYKLRPQGFGVSIYWVKKNSDLQNPPSGPPNGMYK